MKNKFYYVYLFAGTIALILFIYQFITIKVRSVNYWNMAGDAVLMIVLYYMAFKTYHEAKNKELM